MALTIQVKRGLEANRTGITPVTGELIWTTDNKDLWIGDGSTAGGIKATANIEANYIPNTAKGAANGVATLDASGLIPNSQLSPLALTDVFTAANQTEQLALTAQEGDVCVRTDENKSYIHNGGSAGDMTDWQELLSPTDAVQSVNGQTGVVSLDTDDISEGSANLYFTNARADARINAASINALGDVDTTTITPTANDSVLQWDGSDWVPASSSSIGRTDFTALDDTPANYTGAGGTVLKVNAGETAVEFVTNSVENLSDVVITSIQGDDYLKWDSTNSQWVNSAPQTIAIDDLSDVDTTTSSPTSGQVLAWDGTNWVPATNTSPSSTDDLAEGSTNLYYTNARADARIAAASFDDLSDVNVTGVTDGQIITWDDTAGEWQASNLPTGVDGTFTGLTDTPANYTGAGNQFLKVNSGATAVEFTTVGIDELSDVDTTTSTPTSGQVLKWDGSNWAPAADNNTEYTAGTGLSLTGTTFALNAGIDLLSDVDTTTTAPSTNDILGWDGSNWVPGANIDGGTF